MSIRGRKFGQVAVYGAAISASPPTVTFQSSDGAATGGGTTTFTSSVALAIGTASANRRVIVVATGGQGSATLVSCTIQGSIPCDASSIVSLGTGGTGNQNKVFTASAVVPTGTTATVVGTFSSAAFSQTRIAVYTVDTTLLSSIVPTGAYAEATATTLNQSVTASANGFILAAFTTGGAPGTVTVVSSPVGMAMDVTAVAGVDAYAHENGVSSGSNSVTFNWVNSLISGIGLLAFR